VEYIIILNLTLKLINIIF